MLLFDVHDAVGHTIEYLTIVRYTTQLITLTNPTEEMLRLIPMLSNTNNFRLERDTEQPLELRPHCTLKVPLTFYPSGLGTADHRCKISFMCEQVRTSCVCATSADIACVTGLILPVSSYPSLLVCYRHKPF